MARAPMRMRNSAEFQRLWSAYAVALQRYTLEPNSWAANDTLVAAVHLAHQLPHDKDVPVADTRLFEKTMRDFGRRRAPKNVRLWLEEHRKGLDLLMRSGSWPDKGTSGRSTDVVLSVEENGLDGRLSVHNLTGQDVSANLKMLESSANLMLASGLPRVDEIVYGDVYFAGNIDRNRRTLAKYYVEKDNVFILKSNRFEAPIMHSIIHEFGHRYWKKVLKDSPRKTDWAIHHEQVARAAPWPDRPAPGTKLETSKGPRTVKAVEPVRGGILAIVLEEGGSIPFEVYLRVEHGNAVRRAYPTAYASKNAQEHFCEAFAGLCMGDMASHHVEAFERIFGVQKKPVTPPPAAPVRSDGPKGQMSMFNPTRARAMGRRLGRI